jgi:O-antigen ligase
VTVGAAALPQPGVRARTHPRAVARAVRAMDFLFFASIFSVTFEKVHWSFAGEVSIADILALAFLGAYAITRLGLERQLLPQTVVSISFFLGLFVVVYLCGYFDLGSDVAQSQFAKGFLKFLIHFVFLAAGVAYIARRAEDFYWRALAWFTAGLVVNCVYGVFQLAAAQAGSNLDAWLLQPITGGASKINLYGAVNGQGIYRINAISGDPNHLGIFLVIPLLVLTPIALRLARGHPWRRPLAWILGFLFLVFLATLSRSGVIGLIFGLFVLWGPYRRFFRRRSFLRPLAAVLGIVAVVFLSRLHFFITVVKTRIDTSGGSETAHFQVYDFVPAVFRAHPLFGLGLNNFSVYYQDRTGKTNWGPHSFYVALIVETGLVGTLLFVGFIGYLFVRLHALRRLGRALALAQDPQAARVLPLAYGLTAALVATLAANAFYLTLSFYYFYVFAMFVLAAPVVFRRRSAPG